MENIKHKNLPLNCLSKLVKGFNELWTNIFGGMLTITHPFFAAQTADMVCQEAEINEAVYSGYEGNTPRWYLQDDFLVVEYISKGKLYEFHIDMNDWDNTSFVYPDDSTLRDYFEHVLNDFKEQV